MNIVTLLGRVKKIENDVMNLLVKYDDEEVLVLVKLNDYILEKAKDLLEIDSLVSIKGRISEENIITAVNISFLSSK